MTSQFDRAERGRFSVRSPHLVPLVCIAAAVAAANLLPLVHVVSSDPLVLDAGLTSDIHQWLPGLPFVDPNAGFNTQALGHLAVMDWLHGHIPWWNPFEGLGMPLAGEMQSGVFFPLTLLLALHQGVLFVQLALEAIAGWSAYFLTRRLGVGRTFSTAAGVAFGLCGALAWFNSAIDRPVAFLPLCILAVERAITAGTDGAKGGWRLLAVAVALSIVAGFPETAGIDAVFVVLWAALRLAAPEVRGHWRPAVGKLAGGTLVGVGLTAPLLVAFGDYVSDGYLGGHGNGLSSISVPTAGLAQTTLPYVLGPIFAFHSTGRGADAISTIWSNTGGYLAVTVIAAGLVGVVGRRLRALRVGLAAWIALCMLRTFGFPPVVHLLAGVPGIRLTSFYRYANPTWELAAILLAALGLDDIARGACRRLVLLISVLVTAALAAWAAVTAWPLLTAARSTGPIATTATARHPYATGSLAGALVLLALLATGGMAAGRRNQPVPETNGTTDPAPTSRFSKQERVARRKRRGRALMAAVVCVESILLLGFTYLAAPTGSTLNAGAVRWLQLHLGTSRYYTLGPIQPNYGSYYGIAEANVNDLPVPTSWSDYVSAHLDPNAPKVLFTGVSRRSNSGLTPAQELTRHLSDYESIGVRFVVESANGLDVQGKPFPAVGSPSWPWGPRRVYHDAFAEVWELPNAAPLFSLHPAAGPGPTTCTVIWTSDDQATTSCPRTSTLVRREQYLPGWTATIDPRSGPNRRRMVVPVREDGSGPQGLFQAVDLPAGQGTVRFAYLPAHEDLAAIAAAVAALVLVGSLVGSLVGAVRRRHRGSLET